MRITAKCALLPHDCFLIGITLIGWGWGIWRIEATKDERMKDGGLRDCPGHSTVHCLYLAVVRHGAGPREADTEQVFDVPVKVVWLTCRCRCRCRCRLI